MALHHTVLSHESTEAFDAILNNIFAEFEPDTDSERFLALTMAQARWRLARFRRMEVAALEAMLNHGDTSDPHTYLATALTDGAKDKFAAIQKHILTAERCYYKAHKELLDTRKNRAKSKTATRPTVPMTPSAYPDPTDPDVPFEELAPEVAADFAYFESILRPPSEFHYAAAAGAPGGHANAEANDSPTLEDRPPNSPVVPVANSRVEIHN